MTSDELRAMGVAQRSMGTKLDSLIMSGKIAHEVGVLFGSLAALHLGMAAVFGHLADTEDELDDAEQSSESVGSEADPHPPDQSRRPLMIDRGA